MWPRRSTARSRIARLLLFLAIGTFGLACAAALYQAIATDRDQSRYPPPGQLVDVGGHRLHIHCVGQGGPTVVLEAAADMMSADWGWIQPAVAKSTRVCAYDRAGMGWSESGPAPRDAHHISAELHTLLGKAAIDGPYVLVGHSAGGLYVREYTAQYPGDVVGMVLVDPGHPDLLTRIPELQAGNAGDARLVRTMRILSFLGIPRLMGVGNANADGLPLERAAEVSAFVSTPKHWATLLALMDATPASYDQVRLAGSLGTRPLVVISANNAWFDRAAPADNARRALNELHAELARLSANSSHRVVEGASHGSLVHSRNDAEATISAIEAVLAAIQTGRALAP